VPQWSDDRERYRRPIPRYHLRYLHICMDAFMQFLAGLYTIQALMLPSVVKACMIICRAQDISRGSVRIHHLTCIYHCDVIQYARHGADNASWLISRLHQIRSQFNLRTNNLCPTQSEGSVLNRSMQTNLYFPWSVNQKSHRRGSRAVHMVRLASASRTKHSPIETSQK
jgi:hypothetical protein